MHLPLLLVSTVLTSLADCSAQSATTSSNQQLRQSGALLDAVDARSTGNVDGPKFRRVLKASTTEEDDDGKVSKEKRVFSWGMLKNVMPGYIKAQKMKAALMAQVAARETEVEAVALKTEMAVYVSKMEEMVLLAESAVDVDLMKAKALMAAGLDEAEAVALKAKTADDVREALASQMAVHVDKVKAIARNAETAADMDRVKATMAAYVEKLKERVSEAGLAVEESTVVSKLKEAMADDVKKVKDLAKQAFVATHAKDLKALKEAMADGVKKVETLGRILEEKAKVAADVSDAIQRHQHKLPLDEVFEKWNAKKIMPGAIFEELSGRSCTAKRWKDIGEGYTDYSSEKVKKEALPLLPSTS